MRKQFVGQLISEATAMFIILAFGDSVAAMYTLYNPSLRYQQAYWGVCIAWGIAVTLAIYTTASVSGCHANPAVTLSLAIYRRFSWTKVLPYWFAQFVGAFLGAAVVYLLFAPVIDHFNLTNNFVRSSGGAAGVFFTHPGLAITPGHAFVDQVIQTALLIFGIFAITDQLNENGSGRKRWGIDHWSFSGTYRCFHGISRGMATQPRTRFWSAAILLFRRLGLVCASIAQQLLVDSHSCSTGRCGGWRRSLPGFNLAISSSQRSSAPQGG